MTRRDYEHLSLDDRDTCARLRAVGHTTSDIAQSISCHKSTMSRELRLSAPPTDAACETGATHKRSRGIRAALRLTVNGWRTRSLGGVSIGSYAKGGRVTRLLDRLRTTAIPVQSVTKRSIGTPIRQLSARGRTSFPALPERIDGDGWRVTAMHTALPIFHNKFPSLGAQLISQHVFSRNIGRAIRSAPEPAWQHSTSWSNEQPAAPKSLSSRDALHARLAPPLQEAQTVILGARDAPSPTTAVKQTSSISSPAECSKPSLTSPNPTVGWRNRPSKTPHA